MTILIAVIVGLITFALWTDIGDTEGLPDWASITVALGMAVLAGLGIVQLGAML